MHWVDAVTGNLAIRLNRDAHALVTFMTRMLLLAIVVTVTICVAAGCGGQGANDPTQKAQPSGPQPIALDQLQVETQERPVTR
jgi:hypothetical protein